MCRRPKSTFVLLAWSLVLFLLALIPMVPSVVADDAVDLALQQSQIADRFRQLETMLLKMAEYDASSNPRRAALLRQALSQGKERQVASKLNGLVELFQREQLQKAVDGQVSVNVDLKALLDLLLSEDRPDRLKNEQARVRGYIKQLDRIIRQQKSIQGRTEGGVDAQRLAGDQGQLAEKAQELGAEIDSTEGTKPPGEEQDADSSGDGQNGRERDGKGDREAGSPESPEKSDGNSAESDDGDHPSGEDDRSDSSERSGGEGQSGEPGQEAQGQQNPSESQQSQDSNERPNPVQESAPSQNPGQNPGQPGQGDNSSDSPPDDSQQDEQQQSPAPEFPGRKRIAAAEDRMRRAQDDLEKSQRDDATDKQEEARRLLEQAKAELEEILRQLREEEIERVLALLEGRFRRMLQMELKIQDSTVRLSKTPADKRTRQFTVQTGKLSLDQRKVILEVDKALTLLREEGSSVAFPEATQQMRADMDQVARRLSDERVGDLTQAIEADIITALEEMIAALQQAQREAEERRNQEQQQQQQQNGAMDPSNQPLVDQIAELRMIRALQMRVNTRTQRYAKMLADVEDPVGQAQDDDLSDSIRELSSRQERIHKVTSDIILGKNQ